MQVSMILYKETTKNDTQGHNPSTYELCDLDEVPEQLCASASSPVKWEYYYCLSHGV